MYKRNSRPIDPNVIRNRNVFMNLLSHKFYSSLEPPTLPHHAQLSDERTEADVVKVERKHIVQEERNGS